jgi:redox-regulated HSP33 family molecular chaperone
VSSEVKPTKLFVKDSAHIVKALSEDQTVVIVSLEARSLVQELAERLGAYPPSIVHLGQACLGALLLQALTDTDEDEKVELQWNCAGPFGHLYADALGTGRVRATIHKPQAEVQSLHESLGVGVLQVRRLSRDGTPKGTGIVTAQGRVAEDLVDYLDKSEQRSCGMNLSVQVAWDQEAADAGRAPFKVSEATGYIVHVLPQEREGLKQQLLEGWHERMRVMGPLSSWAIPEDSTTAAEHILSLLTVGSKPKIHLKKGVELFCTCSSDRAERALALLTPRERQGLVSDEDKVSNTVTMTCEYCGVVYKLAAG